VPVTSDLGLDALPAAELQFLEPMRAALAGSLPEGAGWLYELKFDGYRTLAIKAAGEVRLLSRNNRVLNRRFGGIAGAARALEDGAMLDGEVVALDSAGRPSFQLLQNDRTVSVDTVYYVFDILALRGKSLLKLPLARRRELLEYSGVRNLGDPIRVSESFHANPNDLVRAAREQKLEGFVAKRESSIYEPGARSGAWVKYKVNQSQEFVIGGYIPGPLYFESLLAGYYEDARLIFISKIKNGFVPQTRRELYDRFQPLETDRCPFDNLPEPKNARRGKALTAEVMRTCRWLKPKLVAQVEFTEVTAGLHLRHSRFAGLRDDKDPREVVLEAAAEWRS